MASVTVPQGATTITSADVLKGIATVCALSNVRERPSVTVTRGGQQFNIKIAWPSRTFPDVYSIDCNLTAIDRDADTDMHYVGREYRPYSQKIIDRELTRVCNSTVWMWLNTQHLPAYCKK